MKQPITQLQAKRALYIDFEGTVADPPSLLGVHYVDDEGGAPQFKQYVSEEALYPAAESSEDCVNQSLRKTLEGLCERSVTEGRVLIAWSSREVQAIEGLDLPSAEKEYLSENIIDGKVISRRWKRKFFPDVEFPYITGLGRHRLSEYMKLIGYRVPASHGPGNTGQRIRYVRNQLMKRNGVYQSLTPVAKGKWTKMLRHNRHDCVGLMEVVLRAVTDLQAS